MTLARRPVVVFRRNASPSSSFAVVPCCPDRRRCVFCALSLETLMSRHTNAEGERSGAGSPGVAAGQAQPPQGTELSPAQAETAEPGSLGGEEEGQILTELLAKAAKAEEYWDRLTRTQADFENYKKRAVREKQEAIRNANEGLLSRLLPVLDNFDMALTAFDAAPEDGMNALKTGVTMIASQLRSALNEAGLEEIDSFGKPFDPNLHEAVSQQDSATVPEDHVMQQLRKGYRYRERLLRPATVVVARKPAVPGDESASNNA